MLMRFAPALFVVLWSTGFIGSRLGAPHAEPFTFLALRFALVLILLVPLALYKGQRVGSWRDRRTAMLAGVLIHGVYLGGVFFAIDRGMPAGVAALIVSLQPVLTSVLAGPLLGERISTQHWLGLILGVIGALLILAPKIASGGAIADGITLPTVAASVIGLIAITLGTLHQKRSATRIDLVAGAVWQYLGALGAVTLAAVLLENGTVNWTTEFVVALGWLVIVLSIGAISLLMLLIRQNAVATVSGLFFLVPAVTAIIAYLMFDETLTPVQLAGLALATVAVLLTSRVR